MNDGWYKRRYRRMLVDMHIPDWDNAFLSKYDPKRMADLYERARVNEVMFYCQSHVGLCNWPAETGRMHEGLRGRDIVRELLEELKKRDIAACAYYSVIYNNWAFVEHPEWRIVPHSEYPAASFRNSRYGQCCPNNAEYRQFAFAQTEELVRGYDFDGFFFDMTFWPGICLCASCREKYGEETGKEIPDIVDWFDPDWCQFQAARERWLKAFAGDLTGTVKRIKPNMSVYHNFVIAFVDWSMACPLDSAVHHDYLGGDLYGDEIEQLTISKIMNNLTENRPPEFMTSRCITLRDHVRVKRLEKMQMQAFAATLFSSAFRFIDAVDPVGTVNPAIYDRIGRIFGEIQAYEPYLGGEPVEDIAIYFSNESKMDFTENGRPLKEVPLFHWQYPHFQAIRGACRVLQQAHVPFGVITRKQLRQLDQYKLIILPNVLRMDDEETSAFRQYVDRGGALYASGETSLTHSRGIRNEDFMLADVFGCHFERDVHANINYIKPLDPQLVKAVAPQDYVSEIPRTAESDIATPARGGGTQILLSLETEGKVLATLTHPYGHPERGCVFDRNWASIHSSPPWEDTDHPMIVRNDFGKGRSVFTARVIEAVDAEVNDHLFLTLVRSLLDAPLTYGADTHPAVWMNVQYQPDSGRHVIGFLNYQAQLPPVPIARVPFQLRAPRGKQFTNLVELPDESPVEFTADDDGTLHAEVCDLQTFKMLAAETDR